MSRSGFTRRLGGRRFQPFNKLLRVGEVPTYGSFSAGYVTTTGRGTAVFVGRAAVAVVLSIVASGAFAPVGNAQGSASLPADVRISGSASNTAFVGAARNGGAILSPSAQAGDLLATGYGAFEVVGSTNEPLSASLSSTGTGTASVVAASTVRSALNSTGIGLAQFGGLALSTGQGAVSSSSTGTANFIGAARGSAVASMTGVAIGTLVGTAGLSGAASMAGSAVGTFIGVTRVSGAASMTGAATASLVGAVGGAGNINIGQSAKGVASPGASPVTSAVATQASGSSFVVAVSHLSGNVTGVTDNKGNTTYTKIGGTVSNGGSNLDFWYFQNGAGGSGHTFTANLDGSDFVSIFAAEITGGLASGVLDTGASADASDNATPFDVTSGTTAQAVELLLAAFTNGAAGSAAISVSSPFTMLQEEEDGSANEKGALAYRIVTSVGAYTASFTDADTTAAGLKIIALKSA